MQCKGAVSCSAHSNTLQKSSPTNKSQTTSVEIIVERTANDLLCCFVIVLQQQYMLTIKPHMKQHSILLKHTVLGRADRVCDHNHYPSSWTVWPQYSDIYADVWPRVWSQSLLMLTLLTKNITALVLNTALEVGNCFMLIVICWVCLCNVSFINLAHQKWFSHIDTVTGDLISPVLLVMRISVC